MSSLRPRGALCLAPLLAASLLGCSEESSPTDPGDTEEWTTGESRSYVAPSQPGGTVADSSTGTTFRFPEGGGGQLAVTDILSGPRTRAEDGAFQVSYSGSGPVELLVSNDPDATEFALSYEEYEHMMLDGLEPEGAGWLPMVNTSADSAVLAFRLPLSGPEKSAGPRWKGYPAFRVLVPGRGSPLDTLMARYNREIRQGLNSLVSILPPGLQQQVRADIDGPMAYNLYVGINAGASSPISPKYVPFWSLLQLTGSRTIVLTDDRPGSLSHELGHYFHHVLAGNSAYGEIAENPRPAGHVVGEGGARNNLIEDAAYFTEYFLKGSVGSRNPEQGTLPATLGSIVQSPNTTDFTNLEGFATAVLASVIREDSMVTDFAGRTVDAPVIVANRATLFGDCYQILGSGVNDIYTLRNKVDSLLSLTNQHYKLEAMLQPIGWSYHVRCRFVDANARPLAGLSARSVTIPDVDGRRYYLPKGTGVSGSDGWYDIQEFFPGISVLRVYKPGGDSLDIGERIPWTAHTDDQWFFGDVVVSESLFDILHSKTHVNAGFTAWMTFSGDLAPVTGAFTLDDGNMTGLTTSIQWTDSSFSFADAGSFDSFCSGQYITVPWSLSITGTASSDGLKMKTAFLRFTSEEPVSGYSWSCEYRMSNLPLSAQNAPYYSPSMVYTVDGPTVAGHVTEIRARLWYDCYGSQYFYGDYVSTDWGHATYPPSVWLEFF